MPSPKDGTAGTIVPPAEPEEAKNADDAEPGKVEQVKQDQRQTQTGKYGETPIKPWTPPETPEQKKEKPSWIEVTLEDEDGNPMAGEHYRITMSDDTVADGTLDPDGFVRLDGIPKGDCKVTFPRLDEDAWQPK